MGRKIRIAALLAAGLLVVAFVAQKQVDKHRARQTIHAFMKALLAGNRPAALAQLHPGHPALAEEHLEADHANMEWEEDLDSTYRIHSFMLFGDKVVAQVLIEKRGVALKPVFHLLRSETGIWKVERIKNLHVDPVWQDVQVELLADEIANALKQRPGVSVDVSRVPVFEESE